MSPYRAELSVPNSPMISAGVPGSHHSTPGSYGAVSMSMPTTPLKGAGSNSM